MGLEQKLANDRQIVHLIDKQDFTINGIAPIRTLSSDILIGQAHAVLAFITGCAADANGLENVGVNSSISLEALAAVQTLLEVAVWHQELERVRGARHGN